MHELSVMTQVIDSILDELEKHDVVSVSEVVVQIGELTFLSVDALSFAWEVLTQENILNGATFTTEKLSALVRCDDCGFTGTPEYLGDPADHFAVPILECPACKHKAEIVRGREFIVRTVRFEERREGEGGNGTGDEHGDEHGDGASDASPATAPPPRAEDT